MPDDPLTQRVFSVIAATQRIPIEKITIDGKFDELGIESMDGINILFGLENEFDITIPDEAGKQIRDIRQLVEGVAKLLSEKAAVDSAAAAN
jgi:acyl carrier protein